MRQPDGYKLLTTKQIAQITGVSDDTVRGWMKSGQLPFIYVPRGVCKPTTTRPPNMASYPDDLLAFCRANGLRCALPNYPHQAVTAGLTEQSRAEMDAAFAGDRWTVRHTSSLLEAGITIARYTCSFFVVDAGIMDADTECLSRYDPMILEIYSPTKAKNGKHKDDRATWRKQIKPRHWTDQEPIEWAYYRRALEATAMPKRTDARSLCPS